MKCKYCVTGYHGQSLCNCDGNLPDQWIDVNDRLPGKSCNCFVYWFDIVDQIVDGYYFIGENKWRDIDGDEIFPTHWQPLPLPPTSKEK